MNRRQVLRTLLESERPLVMPDAYDGLSARLIQAAGFKAVQCSGYSMALASRATREEGLGRARNLEITRDIVASVTVPVMADGEDGFGPPSAVHETVLAFVEAGVAGITLEDQVLPPGKTTQVIEASSMVDKIHAVREAARQMNAADLVINARTDVLTARGDRARGLAEAIERGNRYLAAGADLVFVTKVVTMEEVRQLASEIRGPLSIAAGLPYNLGTLTLRGLGECGVARISLPSVAVYSALKAIKRTLALVRAEATFERVLSEQLLCSEQDLAELFGS